MWRAAVYEMLYLKCKHIIIIIIATQKHRWLRLGRTMDCSVNTYAGR